MRVVITGGCGYIGQCLARSLVKRGKLLAHTRQGKEVERVISRVVLADVARPATMLFSPEELSRSSGVETVVAIGDVADASFCASLLADEEAVSIFHLGAIMSGEGEADFDKCLQVNLMGSMRLLEAARQCGAPRPRFIAASAGATLGAGAPQDWVCADDVVGDWTRATPHTTYGMTKACTELLLADYSRKGFVDGRGVRLPTIVVRAGLPNAATTGCFSGVVRETLAGVDTFNVPIAPDVRHAVAGARGAVDALIRMHECSSEKADEVLGFDRTVFIPSRSVTLGELHAATVAAVHPADRAKKLGSVEYSPDAKTSAAVASFPAAVDCDRALRLGMQPAPEISELVRDYARDFPDAVTVRIVEEQAPAKEEDYSVVLITGGGSGIGRGVALRLSQGKWCSSKVAVIIAGRRKEPLEETARLIQAEGALAVPVQCDLTRPGDVARLFATVEKFGRLDLLFNNAGVNVPPTPVDAMTMDQWRSVVGTNLDAAFDVARRAFIIMKQQGGGRIINNGSVSAYSPRPGSVAYTASKHAITGLTKSLSLDGRDFDVCCGQIDFGNVVSDISAGMSTGMPQGDGSTKAEPRISVKDAANAVEYMAGLPLSANVPTITVMANQMPFVGRG